MAQQELDHVLEAKHTRGIERRDVVAEDPAIGVAAMIANLLECRGTALVDGRVLALPRSMVERFRIFTEATLDEGPIAQTDGDEDVEPRAAIDQQPYHVGRVADEVLRCRRLVIDVACIDVCAVIEQVPGDLDRAGAVQRGLAIAASCEHQRGIAFDQLAHAIELPEVCRGEDVHDRAARDQRRGLLRRDVPLQQAEGPGPPIALQIQIRAVLDQDVEQRQVLPRGHRRPSAERPSRSIHGCTHFGVTLEQRADLFLCRPRGAR